MSGLGRFEPINCSEPIFDHFRFNSDFTDYSITVMETKVALVCHILTEVLVNMESGFEITKTAHF